LNQDFSGTISSPLALEGQDIVSINQTRGQ